MRQLIPELHEDVDPLGLYASDDRRPDGTRPWVLINMIASLDGASTVDGASGQLGGPADRAGFTAVRAVADIILVAAGTARAERYGPARLPAPVREDRVRRGQEALPRIAVVSRRLDFDADLPLFAGEGPRPIVVTVEEAPGEALDTLRPAADVVVCGAEDVDLPAAVAELGLRYGARTVLCEGGPSLNGGVVAAGLLDELCLTVSPAVVGGDSNRIVRGAPPHRRPLVLRRVLEEDGFLLLRYAIR